MRRFRATFVLASVTVLGSFGVLTGCNEDVLPVLGTDMAYSVYALFTPDLDTQWARVFPIEGTLTVHPKEPLDATVTSTDLTTGEVRVWQDSLIPQPNGGYEHAYWSPFLAEPDHEYKLEVERSDGVSSWGTAKVPSRVRTEMLPFERGSEVVIPFKIIGNVEHIARVEVEYHLMTSYDPGPPVLSSDAYVSLQYDTRAEKTAEGWTIPVDLTTDYDLLKEELIESGDWNDTFGMLILGATVTLLAVNEDWVPPGGVYDEEVLGMPNVMSNVTGGFGLIAAGYRITYGFFPPEEASKAAHFRTFADLPQ